MQHKHTRWNREGVHTHAAHGAHYTHTVLHRRVAASRVPRCAVCVPGMPSEERLARSRGSFGGASPNAETGCGTRETVAGTEPLLWTTTVMGVACMVGHSRRGGVWRLGRTAEVVGGCPPARANKGNNTKTQGVRHSEYTKTYTSNEETGDNEAETTKKEATHQVNRR